ncbi:MAG: HAMP domain-containing protein [Leptolyngbyaceae cyanobacterium SM1_3_5]|nr:HAMP domain-containing protein [Leptolyngbyaceae cyanobacterium SM1_3_5]
MRTRLLLWYMFLAGCTAGISITFANSIYREAVTARAKSAIEQRLDQFELYVEGKQSIGALPSHTGAVFDSFLSSYAPTQNEYVITLLNGRLYEYRSLTNQPPVLLQQRPSIIADWSQATQHQMTAIYEGDRHYQSIATAFQLNDGRRGTIVILYDSTVDFQQGQQALFALLRYVLIFLGISFALAWITAGRVLRPLRLMTRTAQSITESDMTQRIATQGHDEIAELGMTFNDMLDRLKLAFDCQKEFIKDASHELRTPITIIRGHLEMLHHRPDRQPETVALLLDELERMSRLVNDLLLLAKTDHPDFLHPTPEELDWLTEEFFLKAQSIADRNWQLELKGFTPITVDRQRLTQAVMNLVQNAVHHTQTTDTITLGSAIGEHHAHLWVRDTGEGIAPQDQRRIFDRFVRVVQHGRPEGHGLGLSIVQAIVQAHGGSVQLESQLGQGSTFTIVLPLEPLTTPAHEPHSYHRR